MSAYKRNLLASPLWVPQGCRHFSSPQRTHQDIVNSPAPPLLLSLTLMAVGLPCYHYRDPNLSHPILDTPHIARLADHYVLGDQLGWGQFGIIRSCTDLLSGEPLACKSISKDRPSDLRLEIDVMTLLSPHPNLVALRAVFEDAQRVHLVMDLCAGGELFHRLQRRGRLPEPEAGPLFRQLIAVVAYLHSRGVVHRDLKPENILLADGSPSSQIKLADFGLAAYIKPGQSLNGIVGSPFYIAPEVLAGEYNQAADVWSAGVILYILLSGVPPFWGKTKSMIFDSVRSAELRFPSDPWDAVSAAAKELVAGMLCRDPAQRLTAEQVLEHSWIKDCAQKSQGLCWQGNEINFGPQDVGACSFSFSFASPESCYTQPDRICSPALNCRSSFSSFRAEATPCSPITGFSLPSSCDSDSQGFSSPIPALLSFAFFNPPSTREQETLLASTSNGATANTVQRDSSFGGHFRYEDSFACLDCNIRESEHNEAEVGRQVAIPSRADNISRKRNHTIGHRELEQLDLVVSESIIRWSSCTHLPSEASLRSSLVC